MIIVSTCMSFINLVKFVHEKSKGLRITAAGVVLHSQLCLFIINTVAYKYHRCFIQSCLLYCISIVLYMYTKHQCYKLCNMLI